MSNDDYTDSLIATIEHQFYMRGKKKKDVSHLLIGIEQDDSTSSLFFKEQIQLKVLTRRR
jgi:hypothetical protein